jgi:hypothetical protein
MKKTRTYTPTAAERRAIEEGRRSPSMTVADFFVGVERRAAKNHARVEQRRSTTHRER